MNAYHIRPVTPTDAPALAALIRGLGIFSRFDDESPETTAARIARHLALCLADASHSVYVAEDAAGTVCGYVAAHWLPYLILAGPEGYVSELFVSAEARGQGLGQRLLDEVKREGQERGCARLSLLNFRHRESYARHFYAKAGWEERELAANFIYPLEQP